MALAHLALLGLLLIAAASLQKAAGKTEYYREELETVYNHSLVEELRNDNKDLPWKCRKDACQKATINTTFKGVFNWPYAAVDTRIRLRCPYSVNEDDVRYAEYSCRLKNGYPETSNDSVWWLDGPMIGECPNPPFVEMLSDVSDEMFNDPNRDWFRETLASLHQILRKYPDHPLTEDSMIDWMFFVATIVDLFAESGQLISSDEVQQLVDLSSYILEDRWRKERNSVRLPTKELLINKLSQLVQIMSTEDLKSDPLFESDNIILQVDHLPSTPAKVKLRQNFLQNGTFLLPEVNVSVSQDTTFESATTFVTILSFRDAIVLVGADNVRDRYPFVLDQRSLVPSEAPIMAPVPASRQPNVVLPLQPNFVVTEPIFATEEPPKLIPVIPVIEPADSVPIVHNIDDGTDDDTDDDTGRVARAAVPDLNEDRVFFHKPMGPLVYVAVDVRSEESPVPPLFFGDVTVDFLSRPNPFDWVKDDDYNNVNDTRCGKTQFSLPGISDHSLDSFYETGCESTAPTTDGLVHCHCLGSGFMTLMSPLDVHKYNAAGAIIIPGIEGVGTFLGFPHNEILYYVSLVLRSISLICLLATMFTFLVFRKARRGTATLILLNLCAALCCMLVMFFIAQPLAESRDGCTVANVLRYYLVMVTLMWSGVEAVNMYLKLVKVFNSDVTHFVLKGAIVAWGVPILMTAVAFAVDVDAFDGFYDDCRFRCSLRDMMLYFGYLLPMGLLIVANSVVFCMVYKAMYRHHKHINADGHKARISRLLGAVSMLILLGVPWVFSAFGAINADGEEETDLKIVEGAFHIVFVVFVNLQGVFIFMFHCVRNSEIRQHWLSLVTSGVSTTDTSLELRKQSRPNSTKSRDEVVKTNL